MDQPVVSEVATAASALRDGVGPTHQGALCRSFDDSERRSWFYWPAPREGLALAALDPGQRLLVHALLARLVSLTAYAKVTAIVALEEVLGALEAQGILRRRRETGIPRDSGNYFTTLFGEPGGAEPWGVRFEGHHVSLHLTVVDGEPASTPLFLGANPAEVRHGDRTVLRPLGEEEDGARSLLLSLTGPQRRRAMVDDTAPGDILTTNAPEVDHALEGGVAVSDLTGEAAALAGALVDLYVDRAPAAVAERVRARLAEGPADLHFAWAGSPDRHQPHYYRVNGSRFLAEYDNTQNGANHAHAVWRDPGRDFGADLLRAHLRSHPHHGGAGTGAAIG